MTEENEANFNELVKALGDAAGVDGLAPEDGRVLFSIDDNLGVSITTADAEVAGYDLAVVAFVVGPVPEDAEALKFLLEENYLGVGSGNGAFSIDTEADAAVLYRSFPLPMDADDFVDAFGRLAGAARIARDRLASVAADGVRNGFSGISV